MSKLPEKETLRFAYIPVIPGASINTDKRDSRNYPAGRITYRPIYAGLPIEKPEERKQGRFAQPLPSRFVTRLYDHFDIQMRSDYV